MVGLDEIAQAAIDHDALRVRSLTQDLVVTQDSLTSVPPPKSSDPTIRSVAAGIVELLAMHRGEPPPAWTDTVGPLSQPIFLVAHADTMPHLRRLCEAESPEPLRRRRIYAPPNFLTEA